MSYSSPRRSVRAVGMLLALSAAPLAAQQPSLGPAPEERLLSLDEALRLALPASEIVGIARAAVARARGEEKKARSEFYPQLNGTISYTRTLRSQFSRARSSTSSTDTTTSTSSCDAFNADPTQPIGARVDSLESSVACLSRLDPFSSFSNLPFGRTNQYNFGLAASQILFAGGRIRAQSRAAAAGRRSAEIGLQAQEAQLTLDITQAYYNAALADRLWIIAQATLALADSTLDQTRLARRVGAQSEFDLLKAQVTRDNQRAQVIQRQNDRELAFLRLKQLLDLPLQQPLRLTTLVEDSVPPPVPELDSLATVGADTVSDARTPVRQAEEALRAQQQQFTIARSERYPAVSVTSNFAELGYPSDLLPASSDFVTDWTVGVSVKLPLFTGGRISGNVMSARAQMEQSRLQLADTRERTALDTRNSLQRLRAAGAAWIASQGTVEQAERAYTIADIRFREGISTQTELADARLQLEQARANRAVAARDLQVARVRVSLLEDLPLDTTIH